MAFVFKIITSGHPEGVSILPFLKPGGLKWQRNDLDSDEAGRTMDGVMHRDRVAEKTRWDCDCRPLNTDEANLLLNLIRPVFITVMVTDPQDGLVIRTFYSNNAPASVMRIQPDGTALWDGISFPLIER